MDQPAWLAAAWAEFGVREIPGKDDAPEILRYFREAGDTNAETDATPWCAAFLGAMLKRGGQAGTGSLLARSYLAWGDALDTPRLGASVVRAARQPSRRDRGAILAERTTPQSVRSVSDSKAAACPKHGVIPAKAGIQYPVSRQ